jgi:FAD/FMN-containing dehydrogenase
MNDTVREFSSVAPAAETLDRLAAVVGERYAIRNAADMAGYMREWRDIWHGRSPLVLRPGSTEEVSRIMTIAAETRTPIVPQSGNTGLVGGQIPFDEVLLSLDRMARVRDVDPIDNTMVVEAGITLKHAQDAAEAKGRILPLSLAAEGSCRIGGNLSTNAGGVNVIGYGSARDLCLGLEVVLADGRIWNGLRRLRKDNTGYDLKDLFIGAEGTLGIITAAVLEIFPAPEEKATALCAVPSPQSAVDLLTLGAGSGRIAAIELLPRLGIEFTMRHFAVRDPFSASFPWYVLIETWGVRGTVDDLTHALHGLLERGVIRDAVIAGSEAQRQDMWRIREAIVESQKLEGGSIKNDVSVPVSHVPEFIKEATSAILAYMSGARPLPFGHLGDGNIHFNVSQPLGMDKQAFLDRWDEINAVVNEVVLRYGGSISAEHGIGRLKRPWMKRIKSPVEIEMMRALKRAFDPLNILNPGKVVPD